MSSAPCFIVTMIRDGRGTWNKDDRREKVNQVGELLGVPSSLPKRNRNFWERGPPSHFFSEYHEFSLSSFSRKRNHGNASFGFSIIKTLGLWLYFEHDVTGAACPPLLFEVILLASKSTVDHDVSTFFGQALLRRFGLDAAHTVRAWVGGWVGGCVCARACVCMCVCVSVCGRVRGVSTNPLVRAHTHHILNSLPVK